MAKEALNGINKFTRRGTQVEERGVKETELGTAQRAEECKTEKIQSQREVEPALRKQSVSPVDETPEVTLDLGTKSHLGQ